MMSEEKKDIIDDGLGETIEIPGEVVASLKDTKGKLRWSLLPMAEVEEVMKVIDFGANKYEPNSWKKNTINECYDALYRHLVNWDKKFSSAQLPLDEESRLDHMAHIAANAIFILYLFNRDAKKIETKKDRENDKDW